MREYFIPDFPNWKNRDVFENAFFRKLRFDVAVRGENKKARRKTRL